MNSLKNLVLGAFITVALTSCSMFRSEKGPIDQERARLTESGKEMTSEGERLIKEGRTLQNSARESIVVAGSLRRQADIVASQGNAEEAEQIRLRASEQEANGLAMIGAGQDTVNRSNSLEKQGEHINSSR